MRTSGSLGGSRDLPAGVETAFSGGDRGHRGGGLAVVGIGPGGPEDLTPRARREITEATVLIGYRTYIDFLGELVEGKEVRSYHMRSEVERGREAIRLAESGERVAVISGGDAGVYGMAGLILELGPPAELPVRIIPGVTAATAAAAALGAPLMNDFAVISLSDLLTPRETIRRRLAAAAAGDLVTVLYNPASQRRQELLGEAREIFRAHRPPGTPVGLVRDAGRPEEELRLTTLENLEPTTADMRTTVIIGNSSTYRDGRWLITPRGYRP